MAIRRKKFEQLKRSLEHQDPPSTPTTGIVSAIQINPGLVSLLIGEERRFQLMRKGEVGVIHSIEGAEWSLSDPSVAEFIDKNGTIVAKAAGVTTIRASVGGSVAQAEVHVYPGTSLPVGTPIWATDPDHPASKVVPAVP